jgi:hypothetical protein
MWLPVLIEEAVVCALTSGNAVNRIGRGATQNATWPAGLRPVHEPLRRRLQRAEPNHG